MMRVLLSGALFLLSTSALAISPMDVVSSSMKYFPQVIESIQQVEESENKVRESRGAFDAKIKGEVDARTKGYYDGDAYKATIEKPFPFLNSRIYGGQRQSYGDFPSYEGKMVTLDDGEAFAGLALSLLRDSMIDVNRYNLRLRRQDQVQAELKLRLMQVNVQTMALKAYWMWVIKGHELKVYQNILGLALTRARQIAKRIKVGDLARIYEAENNQYIRKREAQVMQSQMDFQQASYYLSLFYRDDDGRPRSVTMENLPDLAKGKLSTIPNFQTVYERALAENLDLQILSSQEKQAELDVALGTNEILPKVDLNLEWNQDQSAGPNRETQEENRIMLNVEIPIQYRKGLGKRAAGKAKLAQVKTKSQFTKEKLKVEAQALVVKLNSFAEIYSLTRDQVSLADRLAEAERRKFSQGASDLILVNIREETLAEALVKNLSALLKYQFVDADVRGLQVELIVE